MYLGSQILNETSSLLCLLITHSIFPILCFSKAILRNVQIKIHENKKQRFFLTPLLHNLSERFTQNEGHLKDTKWHQEPLKKYNHIPFSNSSKYLYSLQPKSILSHKTELTTYGKHWDSTHTFPLICLDRWIKLQAMSKWASLRCQSVQCVLSMP